MVDNQVVEVEAGTLAVVRSVPVATGPTGLAVLGGAVWVTSASGNTLTPIDAASGVAGTPIAVPSGADRVAAGFGALWVTGGTDRLTRVVPSPPGVGTPRQSTVTVGPGPIGVAIGAGAVWVADAEGESVSKVDPTSLRVVELERIGTTRSSVAVADRRVYVGFGSSQALRMVSPSPGSEVLDVGTDPGALLAVGPDVWVAGADPGRVLSVSAPGATRVSTGDSGRRPEGAAAHSTGSTTGHPERARSTAIAPSPASSARNGMIGRRKREYASSPDETIAR